MTILCQGRPSSNCNGQSSFHEKKKLLTGKLDCELNKRIIKSTVWNVALYHAAETWALTKASRKLVEAFEMLIWRRMLKISWRDKMTNEVLKRVGETRSMLE